MIFDCCRRFWLILDSPLLILLIIWNWKSISFQVEISKLFRKKSQNYSGRNLNISGRNPKKIQTKIHKYVFRKKSKHFSKIRKFLKFYGAGQQVYPVASSPVQCANQKLKWAPRFHLCVFWCASNSAADHINLDWIMSTAKVEPHPNIFHQLDSHWMLMCGGFDGWTCGVWVEWEADLHNDPVQLNEATSTHVTCQDLGWVRIHCWSI